MRPVRPSASGAAVFAALVCILNWPEPAWSQFNDVAESAGVAVRGARGVGWADYDQDGCVDLLVTTKGGSHLFRNACDGTASFIDVSREAGLRGPLRGWTPAWADYDGDGDLDVYIASGSSEFGSSALSTVNSNALYRNNGDGTFTNVAAFSGVDDPGASIGASWADYDGDGDLDLFVANRWENAAERESRDRLYRNEGNGMFTNVAHLVGVAGKPRRRTFMGVWLDYDNNGTQDLYVAVDFDDDVLYRNNGDGSFTDVSATAGVSGPEHGMGVAVADLNADGCIDIFSTNNTQADDEEHGPSVLYMNNCDGTFYNDAVTHGVLDRATVEWGPNIIDWDNDADLDLAVTAGGMLSSGQPNVLYESLCKKGTCSFQDVTTISGTTNLGAAFGSAWADFDNDGDLDWFVANSAGGPSVLFRNDNQVGRYLKLHLTGVGANTRAVGARLELTVRGRTQYATIRSGTGYASDQEQVAFFGLGGATQADHLRIFWPSGATSEFRNIPANQTINITEGQTTARRLIPPARRNTQ